MAKLAGRKVRIYVGTTVALGTLVAGARTESVTINNEPIDITDKDDDGIRTLLDDVSVRSVEMSVEGLLDGSTLIAKSLGTTTSMIDDYIMDIDGVGTVAGKFHLSSFEVGGPHEDAATFSASFASSGAITFTAA